MWLLDTNLDVHLVGLLNGFGVVCDTTAGWGWKALRNGELPAAAVEAGFTTLATRDRLFAESAVERGHCDFATVAFGGLFEGVCGGVGGWADCAGTGQDCCVAVRDARRFR